MENHHSSPTNNTNNVSEDNIIISGSHHINNELQVSAVLSNTNGNHKSVKEIDDYINSFPPGFRFYPTDVELVTHYLKRKLDNLPLHPNKIYEINIYKYNPETIAAQVKPTTEEKVWYILTPRDRKYRNGKRPSRSAGNGYWKATGADKPIRDNKRTLIGWKKALVFYIGKAPKGEKTEWIMHEYRVADTPNNIVVERDVNDWTLDEWVLCKIYKKCDRDNSMFTQRKRSREDDECSESISEGQDSMMNHNDNHNNDAMTFDSIPVSTTTFDDQPYSIPVSTTSAYHDYQISSALSQFNHQYYGDPPPSQFNYQYEAISSTTPLEIGPISSITRHEYPNWYTSCIGDGYTGLYGEYLSTSVDHYDPMDDVNQYLVNNTYDMTDGSMYLLPQYNTTTNNNNNNSFVNGESSSWRKSMEKVAVGESSSKPKGDC